MGRLSMHKDIGCMRVRSCRGWASASVLREGALLVDGREGVDVQKQVASTGNAYLWGTTIAITERTP